jgi:hypothetical protein
VKRLQFILLPKTDMNGCGAGKLPEAAAVLQIAEEVVLGASLGIV